MRSKYGPSKAITAKTDVLISHEPPLGILDESSENQIKRNMGILPLRNQIKKVNPTFHLFGHIHNQYGMKTINKTTFVNASVCNDEYKLANKPVTVNLSREFK